MGQTPVFWGKLEWCWGKLEWCWGKLLCFWATQEAFGAKQEALGQTLKLLGQQILSFQDKFGCQKWTNLGTLFEKNENDKFGSQIHRILM